MASALLFEPHELKGLKSVLYVVLDSLRWDSFAKAKTPVINRWTTKRLKRFSYASWTQPSHSCLLSGLLPFESLPGVLASFTYATDFSLWAHALSGTDAAKQHLYGDFCLPSMAQRCGWHTVGSVAMPVLNETTPFSRGFDHYSLAPAGSNLGTQAESIIPLLSDNKNFIFINACETHYPYLLPRSSMPRISGMNGVIRDWGDTSLERKVPFTLEDMKSLHDSQIRGAELADERIGRLLDVLAKPAFLLVVSDHGELFGEAGMFGHGPFFHPALFEVPLAVGIVR